MTSQQLIQGLVLAGGKGLRLLPYTATLPKPLVPVGEKPVLEWLLLHLRRHGILRVAIAVSHLRHLIQDFFGDGSALGMHISYVVEDKPLGTAGSLGAILDSASRDILVVNGDLVTDLDFAALLATHQEEENDATIAAAVLEHRFEYGVLDVSDSGRLLAYREKPSIQQLVSLGMYALRRDAVRGLLREDEALDMPSLLGRLMKADRAVAVSSQNPLWLDIGSPDDYARAQEMAKSGENLFFTE